MVVLSWAIWEVLSNVVVLGVPFFSKPPVGVKAIIKIFEPLAKLCSRRLQPAPAQAGKPVLPDISLSNMGKSQPQNEFCKRLIYF